MRSTIDWNELVPLMPKSLRDDLMLNAVLLLSKGGGQTPERPILRRGKPNPSTSAVIRMGGRLWGQEGDGGKLAARGRHYRVNKTVTPHVLDGSGIGQIWAKLVESKNDVIAYEGLASIVVGVKSRNGVKMKPAQVVSALWEKRLIDVIANPKVSATGHKVGDAF